jgi:hypothetical protein
MYKHERILAMLETNIRQKIEGFTLLMRPLMDFLSASQASRWNASLFLSVIFCCIILTKQNICNERMITVVYCVQ